MCWLKKQFSFLVDVAGKRNHGEEKEEPNKQFQVYTYYTYRVSVIQNNIIHICRLSLAYHWLTWSFNISTLLETYRHLSLVPGWGGNLNLARVGLGIQTIGIHKEFKGATSTCMSTWHKNCSHCRMMLKGGVWLGRKWPPLKLYFYGKYPESIFCTDILMTFVTEKNYYNLNPQSYRVSMLQKLRTVTEIQLGKLFTDIPYVSFLSLIFI